MKGLCRLAFSVLSASAFGVVWTAAFAWIQIRDHAYLASGLPNNAITTFVNETRIGALDGALVGVLAIGGGIVIRFLGRSASLGRHAAWLPCLLWMWLTSCMLGARAIAYGSVGPLRVWGATLLAAVWCGLFVSMGWRFVVGNTMLARLIRVNLFVVSAVTIAVIFLIERENVHLLWRMENGLAAVATYTGCWFVAGALSPSESDARRLPWLVTVPVALPWVVSLASVLPPTMTLKRPVNVVLIGIDTLRVDHTSLPLTVRSRRDTTPHLGSFAARGTLFETAIAQAPWTMPSFASIMTGRYPREHGAISLNGYLRPTENTLAELLREANFETVGIVSHSYVDAAHGFAQGFDVYDETNVRGYRDVTSKDVSDRALDYLRGSHREPFFLFLHYFDPHYEYREHSNFEYADGYRGWLVDEPVSISGLRDRRHDLAAADIGYLTDLYDEEVAFTDAQIGRVLSYLTESGLDENTVVIIVSDHGEEFMERAWLGHATSLYEELIRVPLVIALPSGVHQRPSVTNVVETRAIAATVLDFMEPERPRGETNGSLLRLMTEPHQREPATPAFSEVWLPDAGLGRRHRLTSVRTGRWKLIRNAAGKRELLYDLASDPRERVDLRKSERARAKELGDLLDAWSRRMEEVGGETPTRSLTNEEVLRLRSLGYIK